MLDEYGGKGTKKKNNGRGKSEKLTAVNDFSLFQYLAAECLVRQFLEEIMLKNDAEAHKKNDVHVIPLEDVINIRSLTRKLF